ncbi:MAG: mannitol dehydrogenase family protein, partial [Planctomycetota bacterium]
DAVRANNASYYVNVARSDGVEALKINDVELLDPNVAADREVLAEVLSQSTEIVTSLPSVTFYKAGGTNSVVSLIARGLEDSRAEATVIYTAENNNHAAEILENAVIQRDRDLGHRIVSRASSPRIEGETPSTRSCSTVQFLNTVIGKMSRVVSDPAEIAQLKLEPIAPGLDRAFLVEQFNRILVSRTQLADFGPGIAVLVEKDDLLPFEEAKLYGHNAVHSLLGFLGALKGYTVMTDLRHDSALMRIGRDAFLQESGVALIKKHAQLNDELFTEAGFTAYAEELLERMTNPYLGDTIARVVRDVPRKLRADGRIFGTMQLALEHGVEPRNMALGSMAAIAELLENAEENNVPRDLHFGDWRGLDEVMIEAVVKWLWAGREIGRARRIVRLVHDAKGTLERLMNR